MIFLRVMLVWALATPVVLAQSAQELAAQLNSSNYGEREKAAVALEKLGAVALPVLEEVIRTGNLECKRRAAALVERIELRLLREELVQPTPLRLRFHKVPVQEALARMQKQMAVRCSEIGDRNDVITLETSAPYWQAWQQFCQAARLEESNYLSSPRLNPLSEFDRNELQAMASDGASQKAIALAALNSNIEFAPKETSAGYCTDDRHSIRVRARWFTLARRGEAQTPHAVFAFELRAEPRLRLVSAKVEITKLIDADGQELRGAQAATFEVQHGGLLHLGFVPWAQPVRTVKELHGIVHAEVTARPRLIEVKNVLKCAGKEFRARNGLSLKILTAEKAEEGNIRLHLRLDNLEALGPIAPEEQLVRVRPGFVAIRGLIDVALERLLLLNSTRQRPYQRENSQQLGDDKGHEIEMSFAPNGIDDDEPVLLLTDRPRMVSVQVPFVVRSLVPPPTP